MSCNAMKSQKKREKSKFEKVPWDIRSAKMGSHDKLRNWIGLNKYSTVPNWTGPGVRRSKSPSLAWPIRREFYLETIRESVKVNFR